MIGEKSQQSATVIETNRMIAGCKGEVEVQCSFCGGKSRDPFGIMSEISSCCVCGGRGVVSVPASFMPCAHCRGTGAIKTLTCTVCGGKGYLAKVPGQTRKCPECGGAGDDCSNSAMACLRCRGRGVISI